MKKDIKDVLFEAQQTLLKLASMLKSNKSVDFGFSHKELEGQADEIASTWRELYKEGK